MGRYVVSKGLPRGPLCGPLASLKGSQLWAPVLEVVFNGMIMGLQGFKIRGPYQGSIGSAFDSWGVKNLQQGYGGFRKVGAFFRESL